MKQPKLRIRKVFKKVLESGGKGIGKAMIEEGYSKVSALTPNKVTETKSWEMLMEEYLPDELLNKVALEGLNATQIKTSFTEPDKKVPDYGVRQRYLETILKMKGKLVEKSENKQTGEITIKVISEKYGESDSASNPELPESTTDL